MSIPCIILAGGLGTRLRSALPDLPKCLAPVAGRPFLEWQMKSLFRRGIHHFVLALGYGADKIIEVLHQPWAKEMSIDYVIEKEPLGTGGAIRFAMTDKLIDEVLVVNGDTFLNGDLSSLLEPLNRGSGEFMRMAAIHVSDRSRYGGVLVDQDKNVLAFIEKGRHDSGLINAGVYHIHISVFEEYLMPSFSLEAEVMPILVKKGNLKFCEVSGPFVDIGVPSDYYSFQAQRKYYGIEC